MALRPGGNIRPGMVPLNRVVSLVSGTTSGVSPLNEHRAASTGLFSFISIHVEDVCMGAAPITGTGGWAGVDLPVFKDMTWYIADCSLPSGVVHPVQSKGD